MGGVAMVIMIGSGAMVIMPTLAVCPARVGQDWQGQQDGQQGRQGGKEHTALQNNPLLLAIGPTYGTDCMV